MKVTSSSNSHVAAAVDSDNYYQNQRVEKMLVARNGPSEQQRKHEAELSEQHEKAQAAGVAFVIAQRDAEIQAAIVIQRAFRKFKGYCQKKGNIWPSTQRQTKSIQPR
jgi:hypothetical protein